MKPKPIKKLYYSISEVSKLTSLKQYVLRYWETEFGELRPAKNRAGNRIYRLSDIKLIFFIKKLLYDEKFTIEGARQRLKQTFGEKPIQMMIPFNEYSKDEFIHELQKDLLEILDLLNNNSNEEIQESEEIEPEELAEEPEHELNLVADDDFIDRTQSYEFGA